MASSKSPTSPFLQSNNLPSSTTFSDAIFKLGFSDARDQKFEWLTSYPSARPLLNAIMTHFTPDCVLTHQQAYKFKTLTQSQPLPPDSELLDAADALQPPAQVFPNISEQYEKRLLAAKQRLALLSTQRNILREQLASISHESPSRPSSPHDENPHVLNLDPLNGVMHRLNATLRSNPCTLNLDPSIEMYIRRERNLFHQLLSFARQNFDIQRSPKSYAPSAPPSLSLAQLIASYANIKSQQVLQEIRLFRANAILTALNLQTCSPNLQESSTLHAFLDDLRKRTKPLLHAKAETIANHAEEQLWARIHAALLTDTLRRQNHIIETARFYANICLQQRLRIMCFTMATSAQERRFQHLHELLSELADLRQRSVKLRARETGCHMTEMCQVVVSGRGCQNAMSCPQVDAFEEEVFNSGIQSLSDGLTGFIERIGQEGSWLRLDSHPRYVLLVKELESLLNHNTAILEAVLRKRESHSTVAAQNRRWIKVVNESQ